MIGKAHQQPISPALAKPKLEPMDPLPNLKTNSEIRDQFSKSTTKETYEKPHWGRVALELLAVPAGVVAGMSTGVMAGIAGVMAGAVACTAIGAYAGMALGSVIGSISTRAVGKASNTVVSALSGGLLGGMTGLTAGSAACAYLAATTSGALPTLAFTTLGVISSVVALSELCSWPSRGKDQENSEGRRI